MISKGQMKDSGRVPTPDSPVNLHAATMPASVVLTDVLNVKRLSQAA